MTLRWYVARTRRAWDKLAERGLKEQGFAPWLQVLRTVEIRLGAKVDVERPVFPFYQFVRFDIEDRHGPRWRAIYSTPNVKHLLPKGADNPVWIPDDLVHALQGVGTIDEVARVIGTYVEGETKFWIKMGPFTDFIGTYRGSYKGVLQLTTRVFGRETDIEVRKHWAEKL